MKTCAIPIRTLQDLRDQEDVARIMSQLLEERGFDLDRPYTVVRDVALGVYLIKQSQDA